jgi:hypothetical protein
VTQTLVGFALNHQNWRLVYMWCKRLSHSKRLDLQGLPYTCIGHLARLHPDFCGVEAMEFLESARRRDPENVGLIEDAIDDVQAFSMRCEDQ